MRIAELAAYLVHVPLKREIRHASATRRESANLLVRCRLSDGTEGWGEGVPRSYVTGETADGALKQLAATPLSQQLDRDCANWSDVIALCESFRPASREEDLRGCYGNALRCAVELSLLDAFGRLFNQPVRALAREYAPAASIFAERGSVQYSAAIMAESPRSERRGAIKMRLYGFTQCKVKVGAEGADDATRLRRIRRWIGRRVDLRLDANEAWHASEVAERLAPLIPCGITCIEQPVPHGEVAALAELRPSLDVPVMLDESLTGVFDAQEAIRRGTCDLFNIRLSKCGGFLNSLRLAAMAASAGLGYQLGCHPGETGILSAAGRHWACSVSGIRYLEGSYDRHVLAELLTNEDTTFGYGGRAPAIDKPGLGVTVNPAVLQRWTRQVRTFHLD